MSFSVKLTIGNLPSETLNCANGGNWTLTNKNVSALPDGNSITLRVEQQDDLENIGFAEKVIVKDIIHPAPTLTTTTASLFVNAGNEGNYSLQGGCDGSEDVSVTLGTQNAAIYSLQFGTVELFCSLFFIRRLLYADHFPRRRIRQ